MSGLQGWHDDPFGFHESRDASRGEPTELVRDGLEEARDAVSQRDGLVAPEDEDVSSQDTRRLARGPTTCSWGPSAGRARPKR